MPTLAHRYRHLEFRKTCVFILINYVVRNNPFMSTNHLHIREDGCMLNKSRSQMPGSDTTTCCTKSNCFTDCTIAAVQRWCNYHNLLQQKQLFYRRHHRGGAAITTTCCTKSNCFTDCTIAAVQLLQPAAPKAAVLPTAPSRRCSGGANLGK